MYRPADNHGEIGGKHAELRFLLQLSKNVLIGGIQLHDDRGPIGLRIIDDDVDLVFAVERLLHPRHLRHAGLRLVARDKLHDVFYDVVLDRVDVRHDVRELGELFLEMIYQVPHGEERDVLVELLEVVVDLSIEGTQLAHGAAQLLCHLFPFLLYRFTLLGRKRKKLLFAHGLAVSQGDYQQPHGGTLEDKAFLLRLDVKVLKEPLALRLRLPDRCIALVGIILAFKRLGKDPARLCYEGGHLLLEYGAGPGRKRNGARLVLVLEAVYIAPVVGHRFDA